MWKRTGDALSVWQVSGLRASEQREPAGQGWSGDTNGNFLAWKHTVTLWVSAFLNFNQIGCGISWRGSVRQALLGSKGKNVL